MSYAFYIIIIVVYKLCRVNRTGVQIHCEAE